VVFETPLPPLPLAATSSASLLQLERNFVEPFDCAAITTSSGLGPAKGLVVGGVGEAVYGSVKRLTERPGDEGSLELNIVLAKAEGSAGSNSKG
jgi:hypothetical protein